MIPTPAVSPTTDEMSARLADVLVTAVRDAADAGRPLLVGVPAGRTLTPVIDATAERLRTQPIDLDHVVIVLMDDYAIPDGDGWTVPPLSAHYSCRRFGVDLIETLSSAVAPAAGIPVENLWSPDAADPATYDVRIADAGGVDLFFVAVGASDGHVAFNPPGSALDSRTRIIPLAESTRRDNLGTFPEFESLDDVPTHGVSVGLATLADARRIEVVAHGAGKAVAAARLLASDDIDVDWPATFIHGHPNVGISLDTAAAALLRDAGDAAL